MPGPGEILQIIREQKSVTRADVLDITGLSRMTLSGRISSLLQAGLIVEKDFDRVTGGRPSRRLQFNSSFALLVTAAVDTTHTTVAVTDLAGQVMASEHMLLSISTEPQRTLDEIINAAKTLLRNMDTDRQVGGIGISVPGPVDPVTERLSNPPIMPGWDNYPIADHLKAALRAPVLVANDADAAALGEQRSAHPDSQALCFVKVSSGIGAGIILNGRTYQGTDGGAGDIGHVKIAGPEGPLCQCGAHGCLAAVASGRAIARSLTALGKPAQSGSDVASYLAADDPDAARLTQEAGRVIGTVLATVVSLLNPADLVLGGMLATPPLLTGIREALYPRSLPRATRHLNISQSTLGAHAATTGLAALVLDRDYSATNINALLRR